MKQSRDNDDIFGKNRKISRAWENVLKVDGSERSTELSFNMTDAEDEMRFVIATSADRPYHAHIELKHPYGSALFTFGENGLRELREFICYNTSGIDNKGDAL